MGNWFDRLSVGAKYGICFSGLLALIFIYAFFRLILMKRKEKKDLEAQRLGASEENEVDQALLNQREPDEGDLFGVRALERGFYGGVAQSGPITPCASAAPSTSTLGRPKSGKVSFNNSSVDSARARAPDNVNTIAIDFATDTRSKPDNKGKKVMRQSISYKGAAAKTGHKAPESSDDSDEEKVDFLSALLSCEPPSPPLRDSPTLPLPKIPKRSFKKKGRARDARVHKTSSTVSDSAATTPRVHRKNLDTASFHESISLQTLPPPPRYNPPNPPPRTYQARNPSTRVEPPGEPAWLSHMLDECIDENGELAVDGNGRSLRSSTAESFGEIYDSYYNRNDEPIGRPGPSGTHGVSGTQGQKKTSC